MTDPLHSHFQIAETGEAQFLTRDNLQLSRPKSSTWFAINCTTALPPEVARYVLGSLAPNTLRAYESDIRHFENWGGLIPSTDIELASYLASHATVNRVATLTRRLASISKAHSARGFANPSRSEVVKATLRGIKRAEGCMQSGAQPIAKEILVSIVATIGRDLRGIRDRALLLLGFAGGFRRSELVGLDVADVRLVPGALKIRLRQSKTDQTHVGRMLAVKPEANEACPVAALETWLRMTAIEEGPIFRPIDRHGNLRSIRLSGEAVSIIIKNRSALAGLGAIGFSGHSLRAGFVTSSAQAGVPLWKIRQQTGHRSDEGVVRYIRGQADLARSESQIT